MKTRQAADNIRLAVYLLHFNKNKDLFAILSLDTEKAFDKIYR